jgi:hypothetical protein
VERTGFSCMSTSQPRWEASRLEEVQAPCPVYVRYDVEDAELLLDRGSRLSVESLEKSLSALEVRDLSRAGSGWSQREQVLPLDVEIPQSDGAVRGLGGDAAALSAAAGPRVVIPL